MRENRFRQHWALDPEVRFLNHGSFGACPRPVLDAQSELRTRLERDPVRFFLHEQPELLESTRQEVARFVGATAENLAFVTNATEGVNAVVRSLDLNHGDELLVTHHAYAACKNTLDYVARRRGARVVVARVPFPLAWPEEVIEAILARVTPRTRLALVDHVTSPTGLVFPVADIVRRLAERGVDTLVDGAHAPGMLPLALDALGAAYYTANLHKWVCAPKGAGFLYVRADRQGAIHPTSTSHGFAATGPRSLFLEEFDWTGTHDPTAVLSVPAALAFGATHFPDGWPGVYAHNHELALSARALLCDALAIEPPAPADMLGSLVAVPVWPSAEAGTLLHVDALQSELYQQERIQVPVFAWPAAPARLIRISAQLYNDVDEYEHLARALAARRERA